MHSLSQDQSTVARQAQTTVTECSLTSCLWARFPDRFPRYAWIAYSANFDFLVSRMYVCQLNFCKNDRGLLRATVVTRGWNWHQVRVSRQKLWKRKFSRLSCQESNSQPFDHELGALPNELSRLPRSLPLGCPLTFCTSSDRYMWCDDLRFALTWPSRSTRR